MRGLVAQPLLTHDTSREDPTDRPPVVVRVGRLIGILAAVIARMVVGPVTAVTPGPGAIAGTGTEAETDTERTKTAAAATVMSAARMGIAGARGIVIAGLATKDKDTAGTGDTTIGTVVRMGTKMIGTDALAQGVSVQLATVRAVIAHSAVESDSTLAMIVGSATITAVRMVDFARMTRITPRPRAIDSVALT